MEGKSDVSDDSDHRVKLFPISADVRSYAQEDERSGNNISTVGDCHDPVFAIKSEPQESSPDVCLPDWSYLNSESGSDAEDEEECPVDMKILTRKHFNLKSIGREQQAENESPVEAFMEIDLSVKEDAGECFSVLMDAYERKEGRQMKCERLADMMSKNKIIVTEAGDEFSDDKREFVTTESNSSRVGVGIHNFSKLGRTCDRKETFQEDESNKTLYRSEETCKGWWSCDSCSKSVDTGRGFQVSCIISGHTAYKCDICGKVFSNSKRNSGHVVIHRGQKLYRCQHCRKGFASKQSLKRHINIVHLKEKQYECPHCGQKFCDSCNIRDHVQSVHLKERGFECEQCGQRFSKNCNMKKHIQFVHLKVRNYQCDHCGQWFSKNCNMKKHIQTVHEYMRHYECKHCGKGFASKQSMERHIQIVHLKVREHECLQCGQRFGESCDLKRHIQTVHLKLKQYECQHCGQRFCHSCDMKRHVQTVHLKMRQYLCQHCGQRFSQSWNMKSHVQTVHLKTK